MSNTAERWWVRLAARWLARVDGVKSHIQVASLGVTAFSTFSLVLQNAGHGQMVVPLGIAGLIAMPLYTYAYSEGGVWNQVSRDRQDLSTNFSGPTMGMDDTLIGVAAFVAANERKPNDEEREMIEEAVREQWENYREGIDWVDHESS